MLEGGKGSNGPGCDGSFGRTEVDLCCCVAQVGIKCSELLRTLALLPGAVTQLRLSLELQDLQKPFLEFSRVRQGGEGVLGYLMWARCWRRSPMVSESSILSS